MLSPSLDCSLVTRYLALTADRGGPHLLAAALLFFRHFALALLLLQRLFRAHFAQGHRLLHHLGFFELTEPRLDLGEQHAHALRIAAQIMVAVA